MFKLPIFESKNFGILKLEFEICLGLVRDGRFARYSDFEFLIGDKRCLVN
jgi:hypothetical protein